MVVARYMGLYGMFGYAARWVPPLVYTGIVQGTGQHQWAWFHLAFYAFAAIVILLVFVRFKPIAKYEAGDTQIEAVKQTPPALENYGNDDEASTPTQIVKNPPAEDAEQNYAV